MRKLKHFICFFITFISLVGCKKKITIQDGDCFSFNPLETTKVVNDLEPYIDEIVSLNLGEKDSIFFAHIKKMLIADNKDIIILASGAIYRFNSNGELQSTYGRVGRGPGEYISITDIAFNNDQTELLALNHLNQILIFDYLSGNYKDLIDIKSNESGIAGAGGLIPSHGSDFFLFVPNPLSEDIGNIEKTHYCLLNFNKNGKMIAEAIPRKDFNMEISILPFVTRAFDNSYLIRPQENENICYRIKDGEVHNFFKVHFGKQNIEPLFAFKNGGNPWDRLSDILSGNHYNTPLNINMTENHIFFHAIGPNARQESFIVNRDNYTGLRWHNNGYEGDGLFIFGADETYLYAVFMNYGKISEDDLNEMDPLVRYLIVKQNVFLSENSNPLIIKVKFKSIN